MRGKNLNCPYCSSNKLQKRGIENGKQRYQCNKCRHYFSIDIEEGQNGESSSFTQTDDSIHVVCDTQRVMSQEDIIEKFNIDLEKWKIKSFTVKTSEGYRKDRQVNWNVVDGKVTYGHVEDTGKMLIVPMYHVSLELIKRDQELTEKSLDNLFENLKLKNLSPIKINSSQYDKNGMYVVLPIADLHLGLIATTHVEGNEYNMEMAERYFYDIISQA